MRFRIEDTVWQLEVKCTILYQIFNNILYTDNIQIRIIRCHILTLHELFWCKQERFYYLHFSKHRSHVCGYVFAKHRSTEIHTHTLRERTCNVYKYEQKKHTDIEGSILKLQGSRPSCDIFICCKLRLRKTVVKHLVLATNWISYLHAKTYSRRTVFI